MTVHANFWHGGWLRARRLRQLGGPGLVVIDAHMLTSGHVNVDKTGAVLFESFGPDDHLAMRRWSQKFPIELVAVHRTPIIVRRAEHLRTHLTPVEPEVASRIGTIHALGSSRNVDPAAIVYVGDGYRDWEIMLAVGFGIAPPDAWPSTRRQADALTTLPGAKRAAAEALDYIGEALVP